MIIFLLILSGGIIQHHCTDTDINHAVQITGYDFNGKTWVLSLSKETYFPLTEWIALICSVLVTSNNTPNANMADLSVGPGLVARKRG